MRHRALPSELGAAFSVRGAQALGVSEGRLRGRDLVRPFSGVRMTAPPQSLRDRCVAYATRMHPEHFFSHTTAAYLWGAPLPANATAALHVSAIVPAKGPGREGVEGHRLSDHEIAPVILRGLRVADAASAFLQAATLLRLDDLVAVGDHLILEPAFAEPGRPFTTIDELRRRLTDSRSHGANKATKAVVLLRQGAESRPETLVRLAIRRFGLPEPVLGSVLRTPAGAFVARLDMDYPAFGVAVEYDGDQHRTSTQQYEKDMVRLDAVRRTGREVVRIRKSGLANDALPAALAVARALASAGCAPAARALSRFPSRNR
ncbi:hypothetical protein NY547_03930 [Cnuibacter physcomitrellae]|uniref:hypothetical protein n=1 Tax=Cnuibacter physcomitrellae TaxID=1619308 RepID=UPI0021761A00|nr:hypothetical protein [Cnuibacter physcomitrellae]MCS5496386.1 hypothetical protein [Cnuibacter physcomitrellae]